MIKLKPHNNYEKIVLDYLNTNASLALVERINAGDKTLTQCWNYIISEASKLATNRCACVEDSTVYGWAIHFFEEDEIKGKDYVKAASNVKTATSKSALESGESDNNAPSSAPKPKKKKEDIPQLDQMSFDSLFGDF